MRVLAKTAIEEALALMRRAVELLDIAERSASADFIQHAIGIIEEEAWSAVGVHATHARMQ